MSTVRPILEFEGGETSLEVRRLTVHERIDEFFTVDVLARSPDHNLDIDAIVGKGAAIGAIAENGFFAWSGLCNHMEQTKPADSQTGHSTYVLRIVPALWLLTQRRGHRIYQHVTTQDIVTKLLDEYSIKATWELNDDHPIHEYRVQYGETDYDFVTRLLEEAGISFFFKPELAGTTAESKLFFSDAPHERASIGKVPYYQAPNAGQLSGLFMSDVRLMTAIRPGKVTYRDFTFRKPSLALIDSSEFSLQKDEKLEEKYEQYHYFPNVARYDKDGASDVLPVADDKSTARHDNDENKRRAEMGAEAVRWGKRTVDFRSNHPALNAASIFQIDDHPREQLAPGKKLMVVEAHFMLTELDWNVLGTAVFAETPYRPKIDTARPTISGVQTAMVVGPPGQEIYTDEFGRVRVRFHWDREGEFNDDATCWLRVSQAWAGNRFGTMFVPRVGQEVIVQFFEGDPDQPVVIGRLFNQTTLVPRKLPDHKTQSTVRTASSPQTDGKFNEIMFDDAAGKELYFFQAQRDLLRLTKRNDTERVGEDRTIIVGEGRVSAVAHSDSLQVGKQHLVKMVTVNDLKIPDMGDPSVTELDTWIEMVDPKITLTTGECTIVLDGPDITVDAKGGIRFTSDGKMIIKGSIVYLNVMSGSATASSSKKVKDAIEKPDRMIGTIEELFWTPYEKKLARKDQTVALEPGELPGKVTVPDPGTEEGRKALATKHLMTGPPERSEEQAASHVNGIDLSKPVEIVEIQPGEPLVQYNKPDGPQGKYFGPEGGTPEQLGISGEGRVKQDFVGPPRPPPVTALRTTAKDIPDFTSRDGTLVPGGGGGGIQYQTPTPELMKETT
jgi:type VI secretion system secreted protein VgrG